MALTVHDEIWNNYIDPGTGAVPVDDVVDGKYLGLEVGTDAWGLIPGIPAPLLGYDNNGMLVQAKARARVESDWALPYTRAAVIRKEDNFSPDHYAESTQPPPIYTSSPSPSNGYWGTGGAAVRMDPLTDSCYMANINYIGPRYYPGFCTGHVNLCVFRFNAGVMTVLANITIPGWTHCQDHWFCQIQVWGQNPVKLRVVTKAPLQYRIGATSWMSDPSRLTAVTTYDNPRYGGISVDQLQPGFWFGDEYPDWSTYNVAPDNSNMVFPGDPNFTKDNPYRTWVVWEGEDISPQRLLSGRPGLRFFSGGYGGAKFTAGDLDDRLTANLVTLSGNLATIGGYRKSGSIITVT